MRRQILVVLAAALLLGGCSGHRGTPPAMRVVLDLVGARPDTIAWDDRVTVLFFVMADCPITQRYAPEVARIVAAYPPGRVAFYGVYTDPTTTSETARRHCTEYGYGYQVVLDPDGALARYTGAKVAPEVAVLTAAGRLAYRGRIDDQAPALGQFKLQPHRRDLRLALDAVLADRPVAVPETPAVGCDLPLDK